MRRLIYAWNYLEWGGAQIHILALIKLAREEFDVVVVLPEGSDPQFLAFLEKLNVPYEFFNGHTDSAPAATIKRKIQRHWRKSRSEYAMLRHLARFDLSNSIVHVDLSPQQSFASLAWLASRTTVFITSHNSLPPVPKWRDRIWHLKFGLMSRFDSFNVFCSNEDARQYFRRYYTGRVADEIRVTYTSINPPEIDSVLSGESRSSEFRERFGLLPDMFVVLAVGQFIDRKGRWTFVEAAQKVIGSEASVQFLWLTPTLPGEDDQKKIESYGISGSLRLILSSDVGTERHDILSFFRIADAFALPSFVEGLPIALLEAMALGIPSISTNVNAIPEAVKDHQTGILIEAGDSDALASAIIELKNDPKLRQQISKDGREYVLKHFDEREAARTAVEAYREAVRK